MKKLLMYSVILITLISCGNKTKNTEISVNPLESDRVEVLYFHSKKRCATCMAIEKNTQEVLDSIFANEIKNGAMVFKTIDISTPEGEKIADKYEVTWSSLFVNQWQEGREICNNMTEFGFNNARKDPEGFKKGLTEKIRQSLK